ncbi:MAG: hypothetical protein DRJ65_19160 [Acidobacteria bacterium]|nr:MAG: hypothetical protein DRJ65_19160 [Acidobacteriota bacterium]
MNLRNYTTTIINCLLVLTCLNIGILDAEARDSGPAKVEKAPADVCAQLDDPAKRPLMDGVLFYLLKACGREHELGRVTNTPGFVRQGEGATAGVDVAVSDPSGDTGTTSHTQSETSLSLNETTGTICSGYNDSWHYFANSEGFTGYSRSTDGGQTFTDQGALGAGSGGDPAIVWRKADEAFYFAALKSGSLGIWKSVDDCESFTSVGNIHSGSSDDKELMAVDNNPDSTYYGRLYTVWTHFDAGGNIYSTYSDNLGVTWSTPKQVSPTGSVQGSWPIVAPNGDFFVGWVKFGSSTIDIEIARSTNGGDTWVLVTDPASGKTQPQHSSATGSCGRAALNGNIRYLPSPQIAVDATGVLHVVYSYDPDGSGDDIVDVFYRRSTDNGATWSTEIRVNDDTTTTDQFFPSMSVGASGQVSIAWYDRRNDATDNLLVDYYQRMSFDGGVTWNQPSVRLSDVSSPIHLDNELATCYHGDYDTQIQTESYVVAQWADDRNIQDSHPDPDVFIDRVAISTDFLVNASPRQMNVCAPSDGIFSVEVLQFQGFSDPVSLTISGTPTGLSSIFSPATVVPPGSSTLTLGNTGGVAAGSHDMTITGTAGLVTHDTGITLTLFDGVPGSPTPSAPANGAVEVLVDTTFEWSAVPNATTYTLEVARDAAFTDLVDTVTTGSTTASLTVALDPITQYYWRVTAENICGAGSPSAVWAFTTRAIPPILLVDDDDNNPDVRAIYTATLDAMGLAYDIWDTANSDNEPSSVQLSPYRTVIWFTGDEFGGSAGPGGNGEGALQTWMDAGDRCLMISGQDYYYDRNLTGFMTSHLGLGSATSDVEQTTVTGVGTLFSGLGPYTLSYPFSNYSDTFVADAGGELAFDGNQGGAATLKINGTSMGFFLGFPAEALADADRQEVFEVFFGACSEPALFSDGFEGGDTTAWSWSGTKW